MKLPVLEIFGPTIQGEGMVIGRKTMFVRTAGCDYSCSWCDSKFTWDGSEKDAIQMMEPEEIRDALLEKGGDHFGHVTLSGGNPGLLRQIDELVDLLHDHQIKVALETQGSRWQDWFTKIDDLTLSPKPPSSGMKTNFDTLDFIIESLQQEQQGDFSLKVVIFDQDDLHYATNLHLRYPAVTLYLQVGNDEIETDNNENLVGHLLDKYERLIDQVMESSVLKDVRVLPQLHTYLWGNKRGV
ncbi:7-carboxy-7-deazaguanine synthase [Virgibacillus natechei]|uniref:7-carboxy-7-deazaguanine synthase n=1 Tax=Virgibacillus natechei TaxID=1216297 RepID=A0ABS4IJI6_9BACI|nr:7-carboxy-7-deazaguanine synthase QueE [Virgibacillus natechei]MBP1971125.1 7-carboxy-7-deazaguanine synthase [Virgibacillus natechei]UZD12189.1 7-carboxy-7-deazaguanine synthase QueE [Virgibacillus natechei]